MADTAGDTAGTYELALDQQAQDLIELKQKLTYFIITANAVTIAFLVNFYATHLGTSGNNHPSNTETLLAILSSTIGLVGAGACLLSLHVGHLSYTRHLKYRHERKQWNQLTDKQKRSWNRLTAIARSMLSIAFITLFLQIGLAVGFFVAYSTSLTHSPTNGGRHMHHYEFRMESLRSTSDHYLLEIRNTDTGVPIEVRIPIEGTHHGPVTRDLASTIGESFAAALRDTPELGIQARPTTEYGGEMSAE